MPADAKIFALAAEFDSPEEVLRAAQETARAGYTHAEAYTPYPVEHLAEALGMKRTGIPPIFLLGGIVGAAGGYLMLWYANVISYPWNIGGRPPHSWPAFIPITFELMVLCSALFGLLGMLVLNNLPMLYHPLFNLPAFETASQTRFFLTIESSDPIFDEKSTLAFLEKLKPLAIHEVPK